MNEMTLYQGIRGTGISSSDIDPAKICTETLAVTILALLGLTMIAAIWPFEHLPRTIPSKRITELVLSGSFAAVTEEMFFRGWLQPLFRKKMGPAAAVTAVNLIFAPLHLIAVPHIISLSVFFPGMVMGWMKERYGSIWPSVFFHFAGNIWAIWYFPSSF